MGHGLANWPAQDVVIATVAAILTALVMAPVVAEWLGLSRALAGVALLAYRPGTPTTTATGLGLILACVAFRPSQWLFFGRGGE